MDVLLNACAGTSPRLMRPELRQFIECKIDEIPWIDAQQRECVRAMAFQCPAEIERNKKGNSCNPSLDI